MPAPVPVRPPWTLIERAGVPVGGARRLPEAPTGADYYEIYATPVTHAVLRLSDSWGPSMTEAEIQQRLSDRDSVWLVAVRDPMTWRWYDVVEKGMLEQPEGFGTRSAALDRASLIERDIADARVGDLPDWPREDLARWLTMFQAKIPNRVDYVRLLWANDPNGAYDGLLAEPVREAEEAFFEAFEDYLPARPNPVARTKAELLA